MSSKLRSIEQRKKQNVKRPIRIEGDVAYVPLTKGYEAVIDAADAHLIEGYNWSAQLSTHTVYAVRSYRVGSSRTVKIYMHRVILSGTGDALVDHIDNNGLNNRRKNLRKATNQQNCLNCRKNSRNTSGYKGVYWDKANNKWRAIIRVDGVTKCLGRFESIDLARSTYRLASEKFHGEFSRSS